MFWIKYCTEPIPEDMKYPNWQTDRNWLEYTPLMLWIDCRYDEPIPEELKYPGWQTDRNGS